jgi:hypothetical protein
MESITILDAVFKVHTWPLLGLGLLVVVLGLSGLAYTILAKDL